MQQKVHSTQQDLNREQEKTRWLTTQLEQQTNLHEAINRLESQGNRIQTYIAEESLDIQQQFMEKYISSK
jgi:hypothetical protein